ncbi:MAG: hypothetical protein ACRCYO_09305 [Bacteroidia bacterium]
MRHFYFVCGLAFASFISGCVTGPNSPWLHTTKKATFFEHKNDFEVSGNGSNAGGEAHAAYAVTDHWSVSATAAGGGGYRTDSSLVVDTSGMIIQRTEIIPSFRDLELAGGYSTVVSDRFCFEVYGGIGFATQRNTIRATDFLANTVSERKSSRFGVYNRYFIQPAFGRNTRHFDYGFVLRISMLDYSRNEHDMIYEPAWFMRFGYKNVKIMTQIGLQRTFANNTGYDYTRTIVVAGLGLYFQMNQNIKNGTTVKTRVKKLDEEKKKPEKIAPEKL